jgi:transposase
MQTGWFKEVHVKDIDSHSVRALLASRALLVKIKRDLENHVRGLLKNLGLVIGRAKFNVFAVRAEELIEGRPELQLRSDRCSKRAMPSGSRSVSLTARL